MVCTLLGALAGGCWRLVSDSIVHAGLLRSGKGGGWVLVSRQSSHSTPSSCSTTTPSFCSTTTPPSCSTTTPSPCSTTAVKVFPSPTSSHPYFPAGPLAFRITQPIVVNVPPWYVGTPLVKIPISLSQEYEIKEHTCMLAGRGLGDISPTAFALDKWYGPIHMHGDHASRSNLLKELGIVPEQYMLPPTFTVYYAPINDTYFMLTKKQRCVVANSKDVGIEEIMPPLLDTLFIGGGIGFMLDMALLCHITSAS